MVAVRESAGKDDGIGRTEIRLRVPDEIRLPAEHGGGHVDEVPFRPGSRKDGDRDARPAGNEGHGFA
jgi:hypothetical protein